MKKIFYLIVLALAIPSCTTQWLDESEHPMPEGVGQKPEFIFEGSSVISVGKMGGDFTSVVKANQPWLVESDADWIIVNSGRIGKGDGSNETVAFTVMKNASLDPRSGRIRMWITNDDEAFITVNQEPLSLDDLGTDYYVKVDGSADADGKSWATSTTLTKALEEAVDADKIHVAAGTYIPDSIIPGGSAGDETFFVKANINLIGGYPANAKDGDTPDPSANPTILSGDGTRLHTLAVGAPKSDLFSVRISGFTITNGNSNGSGNLKINGATFYKNNGGGLIVGGSRVQIENCQITGNKGKSNSGFFNAENSETTCRNCSFTYNSGANGNCIWNFAGELKMYGCVIANNTGTGVGCGFYNYANGGLLTKAYLVGCEFSGNSAGASRGGGFYGREGSEGVLINCTFHDNTCVKGPGGGVALYGTQAAPSALTMISCTVTGNKGSTHGGGVEAAPYGTLRIYNCIISGNKAAQAGGEDLTGADDIAGSLAPVTRNTIAGTKVYGDGAEIGGSFDFATMFGPLKDGVYPLVGSNNPALVSGMTLSDLLAVESGVSIVIDPEDLKVDQKFQQRTGPVMGAYVGN